MLLMTLLTLLDATLQAPTVERRDVTGDKCDDDDDDGMTVSRDVDASDSELAYRFCSLMRLQQLRTADKQTSPDVDFQHILNVYVNYKTDFDGPASTSMPSPIRRTAVTLTFDL